MTKGMYDIGLLIGLLLIGIGTALKFGVAIALIIVGALVIGLTLIGATLSKGRA